MCEFCEKENMENKMLVDKYAIDLQIDNEFLYAWCKCGRKVVIEVNYCPMCGRDLRSEQNAKN